MSSPNLESSGGALPLTYSHTLLTSFNNFLITAIHNLLYYRNLYPQETFLAARAYNLPVHQNRHPHVCRWVSDAVAAVAAQLASGTVARVGLVLHAPLDGNLGERVSSWASSDDGNGLPAGAVLERWMFDVSRFPAWPGGREAMLRFGKQLKKAAKREDEDDILAPERPQRKGKGKQVAEPKPGDLDNVNWTDVNEQFRGAMLRLAHTAENMDPLPDGCTYTVAVELHEYEEGKPPIGHPQAWIPSEPNLQPATIRREDSENGADIGGVKTTAVRSVGAGPLFFECWVEEGKAKEGLGSSGST